MQEKPMSTKTLNISVANIEPYEQPLDGIANGHVDVIFRYTDEADGSSIFSGKMRMYYLRGDVTVDLLTAAACDRTRKMLTEGAPLSEPDELWR